MGTQSDGFRQWPARSKAGDYPRRKAVTAAIALHQWPRQGRRVIATARKTEASCGTFRSNQRVGSWVQLLRLHPLTGIKATANQSIEGHLGLLQHRQTNPRSRGKDGSRSAGFQQGGIRCRDKKAVALAKGLPRQVVVERWGQPLADHGDCPVSLAIDQAQAPPGWGLPPGDMNLKAQMLKPLNAGFANRIAAEGRKKLDRLLLQPCQLHRNDGTTTSRFLQGPQGMTNGPGTGQLIHRQKFHPLDMADDGQAQGRQG